MYYLFLAAIMFAILRAIMIGKCRKRKKRKVGNVTLQNNIIELSRKGKK